MHKSVLLDEVLQYLCPAEKAIVLDCTVGGGGHAKEILKRFPKGTRLVGIDADSEAVDRAAANLSEFAERVILVNENYRNFDRVLKELNIEEVDCMLFDLGISSFQLEDPKRGFSFARQGPLDMRMDARQGRPLAEILKNIRLAQLEEAIREFGEEHRWRSIARAVFTEIKSGRLADTAQLADVIRRAARYRPGSRIDAATRTFQALRILVNEELTALKEALEKSPQYLKAGGRIVVISFHSLEDRIVKNAFRDFAKDGLFELMTKKPLVASEEELSENPRARSAKLRAARRM